MPTILFVCTGNLCRSPMAEALLRDRLNRDEARGGWQVESAGTWAAEGRPAASHAIKEMEERGIDLYGHRARKVTHDLLKETDLVLAMTANHVEALNAAFPNQGHKVYLLSEMIGETYSISDPYRGSRLEYAYAARELEQLIEEGYDRIMTLVEKLSEGKSP